MKTTCVSSPCEARMSLMPSSKNLSTLFLSSFSLFTSTGRSFSRNLVTDFSSNFRSTLVFRPPRTSFNGVWYSSFTPLSFSLTSW
jgi:hypothetical protein